MARTKTKHTTTFCCCDCGNKQEQYHYEFHKAAPPRCSVCGGPLEAKPFGRQPATPTNRRVLSIDEVKRRNERHRKKQEQFPEHQLKLQRDGTYRSPDYTFAVSRWPHLRK